jgi:hypothetical protein
MPVSFRRRGEGSGPGQWQETGSYDPVRVNVKKYE